MSKKWISYIEYLVSIGRKNTDDLTTFEACHLSGLLMSDKSPQLNTIWLDNDLLLDFIRWITTGEGEDEKIFLNSAKEKVIKVFKPMIDLLFSDHFIRDNKTKCTYIDENRESVY